MMAVNMDWLKRVARSMVAPALLTTGLLMGTLAMFVFGQEARWNAHPGIEDQVPHSQHEIPEDEIIQLPIGRFPDPFCEYSVHHNDRHGIPVGRRLVLGMVSIGDPLYHRWKCIYPSVSTNVYCMVVYNCTIGNGERAVKIIDDSGCTRFPSILPHVSYFGDLEAGIPSQAFSLDVDHPTVYFNCAIKLMVKDLIRKVCPRPTCPGPSRVFRERSSRSSDYSRS